MYTLLQQQFHTVMSLPSYTITALFSSCIVRMNICINIWSKRYHPAEACDVLYVKVYNVLTIYTLYLCTGLEENCLWLCDRGVSSLCGVVTALCTCTCWCVIWSFNILRLLTFMMEVKANNTWNTCWTYKRLLLIHSLMMAPWCWNM